MPDACDRMVDLQLEVAEVFTARRLALLAMAVRPDSADCVRCGEPIDAARLEALPSACRCIYCQKISERLGG